ncbi:hypothetical protein [Streptomyces sp. NPDC051684]
MGGGEPARDVFVGVELGNWADVLIGMLLTEPALGSAPGSRRTRCGWAS